MRIAFISYEYPPDTALGGIATYVKQAAHLMAERGHAVEVFAATQTQSRTETTGLVQVHWCLESDREQFRDTVLPVFSARHQAEPFDVMEGPEYHADAARIKEQFPDLALVVKMHTPTLLIAEISDYLPSGINEIRQARKKQLRDVAIQLLRKRRLVIPASHLFLNVWERIDLNERSHAHSAEVVACPCLDLVRYATQKWQISPAKVRHLPYPYIPSPDFLKVPIDTHTGCIGFFGRLEQRKGVQDLTTAIPLVLKKFPTATFRFVGRSLPLPPTGRLAEEVLRDSLGDASKAVEFLGPVAPQNVAQELAVVDICVYPSIWENFPNVCLEAMASGRGIIGSQAGGMAEMLSEGAGLLIPSKNPQAIAEAILSLLVDPKKRVGLGKQARERLLREYNEDRIGGLMEDVYAEAISLVQQHKLRA